MPINTISWHICFTKVFCTHDDKEEKYTCDILAVETSISAMTRTCESQIKINWRNDKMISKGVWVTSDAAARIDLAGAWTDTPPICSDLGGQVCGLAFTIDGKVCNEHFCNVFEELGFHVSVSEADWCEGKEDRTHENRNDLEE